MDQKTDTAKMALSLSGLLKEHINVSDYLNGLYSSPGENSPISDFELSGMHEIKSRHSITENPNPVSL